jgi:hypothetical protein
MKSSDYRKLLEQALSTEYGIKLEVDYDLDAFAARSIRRRLYQERDRARRQGDRTFDSLSVCIRNAAPEDHRLPRWEVWIVRRDWIRAWADENDGFTATPSPPTAGQVPLKIFARGPNRPRPVHFDSFPSHTDLP